MKSLGNRNGSVISLFDVMNDVFAYPVDCDALSHMQR